MKIEDLKINAIDEKTGERTQEGHIQIAKSNCC